MFSDKKIIDIPIGSIKVEGILSIPKKNNKALIIFVHGSGSSRKSPRNIFVADLLNKNGFSTLLFDLLTEEEDMIYENRFNIPLLIERLELVTLWTKNHPELRGFSVSYFGSSTGAAAAIIAAVSPNLNIKAVVSRGGRPDLAKDYLSKIRVPILLIVGSNDTDILEINEKALKKIQSEKKLKIIPGATHLFEEIGALEQVAKIASNWLIDHLAQKGGVKDEKP